MKVVHIESGLGNQMLSFAEYLVIKKMNPTDDCYIETMIYDIPKCGDVICQWNGYELQRIFNIHVPNIKELFTEVQWTEILKYVEDSEFWNDGWRYAPIITNALNAHGLNLINTIGNDIKYRPQKSIIKKIMDNRLGYDIKRITRPLYLDKYRRKFNSSEKIFIQTNDDIFAGQNLGLRNYGVNIEFIEKEIKEVFKFSNIEDVLNLKLMDKLKSCESVAIHARRGDMLQSNGYCYKYGYFRRAVKYIKQRISNPEFFFFCDTKSIEWCKKNDHIFGLDFQKDKVFFVDWNTGSESYRDMQLMTHCKHNIITNSSFGWWGAYFNSNPNKITISPNVWLNTTVTL